jgi:hypothetical protein
MGALSVISDDIGLILSYVNPLTLAAARLDLSHKGRGEVELRSKIRPSLKGMILILSAALSATRT